MARWLVERRPDPRVPPALASLGLITTLALAACTGDDAPAGLPRELAPGPNPYTPDDPAYSPQPHRDRPSAIVASLDGRTLYVALTGTDDEPGREIAVVDAATLVTRRRIRVGPRPLSLALHPGGRFLAVPCQTAAYVPIVDTVTERVVAEVPTPYYTEHVAFTPDGRRAFLTNRWKDSVLRWSVEAQGGSIRVTPLDVPATPDAPAGIAVSVNPRRVLVTDDGTRVLVTSETGLTLTQLDALSGAVLNVYRPNSPVLDAAVVGDRAYVLHIGSGTNHPPDLGMDGDADGEPGDGTANVQFQDVQNEIDVVSLDTFERLHRYTSDTICCFDFRDVDPDHPETGMDIPPPDTWPPSRVAHLPPRSTWIVGGALPERAIPILREDARPALAVVYQGSSQVQTFDIDEATGALSPRETADTGLYRTGFGAIDAVAIEGGRALVVADRLGETLTRLDLTQPPSDSVLRQTVGDVSGGPFPATDAELGEAFNFMTALFTVDGDQTCAHCHRDGTPIAKAVSMPLMVQPMWGQRHVLSYRGAFDTRPWFLEGMMDETNFFAVINEFSRKENFCCEQTDTRVWSRYPTSAECEAEPSREGCNHRLRCTEDPPPECATRTYGARALTRDEHFRDAATRTFGRDMTFGDVLYRERVGADGSISREPIPLGFDGITRSLGQFLLVAPRLLPNPNAVVRTVPARVGESIYLSAEAGCAVCHPLPTTATAHETATTSAPGPISFPLVVTPDRNPVTGEDADRLTAGFLQTFPRARQTEAGLRTGVLQLRGAWDRALFLHTGCARNLREALATPHHPGLREGEVGCNVRDGQPNTHGGTSHLSAEELDALVAFVETL